MNIMIHVTCTCLIYFRLEFTNKTCLFFTRGKCCSYGNTASSNFTDSATNHCPGNTKAGTFPVSLCRFSRKSLNFD